MTNEQRFQQALEEIARLDAGSSGSGYVAFNIAQRTLTDAGLTPPTAVDTAPPNVSGGASETSPEWE